MAAVAVTTTATITSAAADMVTATITSAAAVTATAKVTNAAVDTATSTTTTSMGTTKVVVPAVENDLRVENTKKRAFAPMARRLSLL